MWIDIAAIAFVGSLGLLSSTMAAVFYVFARIEESEHTKTLMAYFVLSCFLASILWIVTFYLYQSSFTTTYIGG